MKPVQTKKVHLIPYEERFGEVLPLSAYPLPIPGTIRLPPRETKAKWWPAFLDFAERWVELPSSELDRESPRKLWLRNPRNQLICSLYAGIICDMRFYARWKLTPEDEDTRENFPRGLKSLINRCKKDVLHGVKLCRDEDWAQHVVEEYYDAFDRCRTLCDATRRGHLAPKGKKLFFEPSHVNQTFKDTGSGFVGLVHYGHVRTILLSMTSHP